MNWFDTSGFTSLAKTALKEAQKTIDKALDIQDESGDEQEASSSGNSKGQASTDNPSTPAKDNSDFFSSWGLTVSAESEKPEPIKEQPVVTESPSKTNTPSLWGSFAGSFFEQPKSEGSGITHPPKAKSMNLITDKYDSQDDLFSKSQLVMTDGSDYLSKIDNLGKVEERRNSSISNMLSLVSSRNSSDSVEVLSQSLKSTPDSEAVSCPSMSHSSSAGPKLNSDSVEILPDSLVSPSSIECLGFDSYTSDRNSSTSSNVSPCDLSDKKSTPFGERTERPETNDSVSLVADDDEDTMSYNSISECTAPTVLDTDDKPVSPYPKTARIERSINKKDADSLPLSLVSQRMHISENSSNDGSWSDRTLNADNDSINMEISMEDVKRDTDQEDTMMEKLSDSSSFYDVKVTTEMLKSETSAFVNVEMQQCIGPDSSESSQREVSIKERTSPISSDSKSDLVKIGSDRTSGHTSGDELETATSSDIEIIPSPNGDGSGFRNSPGKCGFRQKADGSTSPNLVHLVLGKTLASKIRGHNRELSEASIQSNTSDESQCSENDRLMKRLCEMAEILDARENRLIEVSRSNAELAECNASLKSQVESLIAKHEVGDITTITEDYTQRMSALEKKFQQAIREKDHLRKQLDTLKADVSRKHSSEMEATLKEKEEMIAQLQEEGEKLARHELQHSNIIKKLRAKEKDNEQAIRSLRDKVAEQTAEIDRMKRSMAAKEELEVSQIEAVYRLTAANEKLAADLDEMKSAYDDCQQKLESCRTSLEAVRRDAGELPRARAAAERAEKSERDARERAERAARDAELLRHELTQLRHERAREEQRWATREEALRQEVADAREAGAALSVERAEEAPAALLQQLAALQRAALERERAHAAAAAALQLRLVEAERVGAAADARERAMRADAADSAARLAAAEAQLRHESERVRELSERAATADLLLQRALQDKEMEIERLQKEMEERVSAERARAEMLQQQWDADRAERAADERRRSAPQEPLPAREVSPAQSVVSDSFSGPFWQTEDVFAGPSLGVAGVSALGLEEAMAGQARRAGERRSRSAALAALAADRAALRDELAALQARYEHAQSVQEQYDALLQMYGEKEEQLAELRLDLHDVTQLYKAQLDELIALKSGR